MVNSSNQIIVHTNKAKITNLLLALKLSKYAVILIMCFL